MIVEIAIMMVIMIMIIRIVPVLEEQSEKVCVVQTRSYID